MAAPRPSPLRVLLLMALLCLLWGSTWVVIKNGLDDLPPLGSAAVRFVIAATVMSVVCALFSGREGGARPTLALTLVLGTLNFACSYGIVYWTESRLPSALTSVLWAVYPLLQALSGHLFLSGERLAPAQGAGFVIGFLGVAALFATDLRQLGPSAVPAGAVLLLSPIVSALGTTYVKKHGGGTSSLRLNRNAMWVGAAWLVLATRVAEPHATYRWTGSALFSLFYLALFGTVLTFGLYFWLLRHTQANRMSVIAYVTPAVALVLGWALRGEPIGPWTLAGLGSILAGVFLVHRGGPRSAPVGRPAPGGALPSRAGPPPR